MRKYLIIFITLAFLITALPIFTIAIEIPPTFQAHLWIGDQYTNFNDYENSLGYVGSNDDPWLEDSIVDTDPFNLFIYNASNQLNAVDVHVIATIHSGESGSFSFFGSTFDQTDFSGTGLPTGHNGAHGVWSPAGDGMWLDINTLVDIGTESAHNFGEISFSGFSEVHFDVWSYTDNSKFGLINPYSHDKTSRKVPEPSTLIIIGAGLVGIAAYGRMRLKK